ncbi:S41 family peptidase [Flaviaesturariibacter amylovorans]|uniref:Tail specific protease domain-containing protein n=1 Tax=Flaviaesturariibacter amylovorans TaxID=1084520 RepID=A0ABP8GEB8_9BACT
MYQNKPTRLFIAIALFLGTTQHGQAQALRVRNQGFEEAASLFSDWTAAEVPAGRPPAVSFDQQQVFEGGGAVRLQVRKRDGRVTLSQGIAIAPSGAMRQIQVFFAARVADACRADMLLTFYRNGKLTGVPRTPLSARRIADTAWTVFERRFPLPQGTDSMVISLAAGGAGAAWFDYLQFFVKREPSAGLPLIRQAVLDTVLAFARERYVEPGIDWNRIAGEMQLMASGAEDSLDLYPSLLALTTGIGDRRVSLHFPDRTAAPKAGLPHSGEPALLPSGNILQKRYAYLRVPTLLSSAPRDHWDYTRALLRTIGNLDQDSAVSGWILDLRGNRGGSFRPMVQGLFPLLDAGHSLRLYYRVSATETREDHYDPETDGSPDPVTMSLLVKARRDLPVAVLLDKETSGAAEMALIALKSSRRTKSFGQESAGAAFLPGVCDLPGGGYLILPEGHCIDRKGVAYPISIRPEVRTPESAAGAPLHDQAAVQAAQKWIDEYQQLRAGRGNQ